MDNDQQPHSHAGLKRTLDAYLGSRDTPLPIRDALLHALASRPFVLGEDYDHIVPHVDELASVLSHILTRRVVVLTIGNWRPSDYARYPCWESAEELLDLRISSVKSLTSTEVIASARTAEQTLSGKPRAIAALKEAPIVFLLCHRRKTFSPSVAAVIIMALRKFVSFAAHAEGGTGLGVFLQGHGETVLPSDLPLRVLDRRGVGAVPVRATHRVVSVWEKLLRALRLTPEYNTDVLGAPSISAFADMKLVADAISAELVLMTGYDDFDEPSLQSVLASAGAPIPSDSTVASRTTLAAGDANASIKSVTPSLGRASVECILAAAVNATLAAAAARTESDGATRLTDAQEAFLVKVRGLPQTMQPTEALVQPTLIGIEEFICDLISAGAIGSVSLPTLLHLARSQDACAGAAGSSSSVRRTLLTATIREIHTCADMSNSGLTDVLAAVTSSRRAARLVHAAESALVCVSGIESLRQGQKRKRPLAAPAGPVSDAIQGLRQRLVEEKCDTAVVALLSTALDDFNASFTHSFDRVGNVDEAVRRAISDVKARHCDALSILGDGFLESVVASAGEAAGGGALDNEAEASAVSETHSRGADPEFSDLEV